VALSVDSADPVTFTYLVGPLALPTLTRQKPEACGMGENDATPDDVVPVAITLHLRVPGAALESKEGANSKVADVPSGTLR